MPGHLSLWSAVRDRALWSGALPWTLLALTVLNPLVGAWGQRLAAEHAANLMLRQHEQTAATSGARPSFDWSVGERLGEYLRYIPRATDQPLVILLGMSQQYAINDPEPSDHITAEWLDAALAPAGTRVFGLAAPNLHNEEALLYLLALTGEPQTRPAALLYGLCFDKFRNGDVRASLLQLLRDRPALLADWQGLCTGRQARFAAACDEMRATAARLEERSELGDETPRSQAQGSVEQRLRAAASRLVPLVRERRELNSHLQTTAYLLRNAVLGIKNTSKRPIIEGLYERNRQFLELMMEVAAERGVRFASYIIPLNPHGDNPYVPEEYAAFKVWARALSMRHGAAFDDLDELVPKEEWGLLHGEPDFKHFKGAGHRRTSAALVQRFAGLFRDLAQEHAAR